MSAFLNRYCISIAPYPGAFISLISTHQRLIYSSAPVSPFWRTQVVLASIRLFAAVFLTTLKRRGCSILRYMTTVVHLVCFSRVLRAAHVDPVRVHKRSPTLANHAFHCSQVASRSITVAVCGRSGCSSRLHSGYSSKIVKSSTLLLRRRVFVSVAELWLHSLSPPQRCRLRHGILGCPVVVN